MRHDIHYPGGVPAVHWKQIALVVTGGAVLAIVAPHAHGSPYSDAVLADNPVSYWQFEDASANDGDPAADTQGVNPGTYRSSGTSISLVANPLVGLGGNAADFSGSIASHWLLEGQVIY